MLLSKLAIEDVLRNYKAMIDSRKAKSDIPPAEQREAAIDFDSFEHWMAWTRANPHIFTADFWNGIAARIRANGFVEPLTGTPVRPDQIEGPTDQLREGLVYNGLNARARAVMRMIEKQINMESWATLRIYAPEAVTVFALRFRGIFPRFVGSEFAANPIDRQEMFPIPFEDLTQLSFPDGVFDVVTTNEVLEHLPYLDKGLREIRRVLKPGGWHIGTHPFRFLSADSEIRARLVNGEIEHLAQPEYHGNPFEAGGSLVFEVPGWDILKRCRDAGFSRALIRYCISERYGYVAEHIGGVLVLCCQR